MILLGKGILFKLKYNATGDSSRDGMGLEKHMKEEIEKEKDATTTQQNPFLDPTSHNLPRTMLLAMSRDDYI